MHVLLHIFRKSLEWSLCLSNSSETSGKTQKRHSLTGSINSIKAQKIDLFTSNFRGRMMSRIIPRNLRGAQALWCRGLSSKKVPVHRHSARDHQRLDLAPWDNVFSPSNMLPASFSSRFRDIEKMMRDMENFFEHKYLSFPARGEESEVSLGTPPPPIFCHKVIMHQILNDISPLYLTDNTMDVSCYISPI